MAWALPLPDAMHRRSLTRLARRSLGLRTGSVEHPHLVLVQPVIREREALLRLTAHLAERCAAESGCRVPAFSEDAVQYLLRQRWTSAQLLAAVRRAVAVNRGSLVVGEDLAPPHAEPVRVRRRRSSVPG